MDIIGKFLGNIEFLLEEKIIENKELKKGFDLFEDKISQYEEDHSKKFKRNEEIIEDLKLENRILKYIFPFFI